MMTLPLDNARAAGATPGGPGKLDSAMPGVETWIQSVAEELGTRDRDLAARVLGAWLQMLRNLLTAEAAARFAAELPVGIEGIFSAGRVSGARPANNTKAYTIRFARAARIPVQDVSHAAPAATAAVRRQIPPSAAERALAELAPAVRSLITGQPLKQARQTPQTAGSSWGLLNLVT